MDQKSNESTMSLFLVFKRYLPLAASRHNYSQIVSIGVVSFS
jgi:hypothetical protein